MNENLAGDYYSEEPELNEDEKRYYYIYGKKLEKKKRYTIEDLHELFPEGYYVELIDGVFYEKYPSTDGKPYDPLDYKDGTIRMDSPSRTHQTISRELLFAIHSHIASIGETCEVFSAPFDVHLSKDDETFTVEPDIFVVCDPGKLTEKGCDGAPDWTIEIISPNNASHDYIQKLRVYMLTGVREYWIVDPIRGKITVYDSELVPRVYSFKDKVPVGICADFSIDFTEIG